jgi:hypothetical protein
MFVLCVVQYSKDKRENTGQSRCRDKYGESTKTEQENKKIPP